MANTTVKGAASIHGQNPQVSHLCSTSVVDLTFAVFSWDCDPKPNMGVGLLEGALLRIDRFVSGAMNKYWTFWYFFLAESLIDKAIELRTIGGVYGNQRPTEFLCLLLKLLQIQPEKEILIEYLQADEFK